MHAYMCVHLLHKIGTSAFSQFHIVIRIPFIILYNVVSLFQVAGIVANLIQVALSLLFYLQVYLEKDIDQGVFWALALLSPCAFSFALDKVIYS